MGVTALEAYSRSASISLVTLAPPTAVDKWKASGSPDWYICRAQDSALLWPKPGEYSKDEYLRALGRSTLSASELRTMMAMADVATSRGITTVDRATISREVGVSEWTVTQHWKRARELRLLSSQRRFDSSSVHYLLVSGSIPCPLDANIKEMNAHAWSDSELAWWASIGTADELPPPWGEEHPPF